MYLYVQILILQEERNYKKPHLEIFHWKLNILNFYYNITHSPWYLDCCNFEKQIENLFFRSTIIVSHFLIWQMGKSIFLR